MVQRLSPKLVALGILGFVLVVAIGVFLFDASEERHTPQPVQIESPEPLASPAEEPFVVTEIIGYSVEGRAIESYSFGYGSTSLLFVGGVHGGYEWNSTLLAYEAIDYLTANPDVVRAGQKIVVIPTLNPDGLFLVTGKEGRFTKTDISTRDRVARARFNANGVDLNRNFACKWQSTSMWRGEVVNAGSAAFSEPEAETLRKYVELEKPRVVVFWHSKANAVYASECEDGILPETRAAMNAYATAGSYGAVDIFDAYPVTGDAEGWLASIGIPAITVELETADTTEWERNRAGIEAIIALYATQS